MNTETLFDIIDKYGHGKGETVMWQSVKIISDAVEKNMDVDAKKKLARSIYSVMAGGHYNEAMAMDDVHNMYFIDDNGLRHDAPYWTVEQVRSIYDKVGAKIPGYNEWDFFVALNMIASDNAVMYRSWFPSLTGDALDMKFVEATINWLHDPDQESQTKIWDYLNKVK